MADNNNFKESVIMAAGAFSAADIGIIKTLNKTNFQTIHNLVASTYSPEADKIRRSLGVISKSVLQFSGKLAKLYQASIKTQVSPSLLRSISAMQTQMALYANLNRRSQMIADACRSFESLNINGTIQSIQNSIDAIKVSTPDIAFIKTVVIPTDIKRELDFPKGFKTAMRDLNVSTAVSLAQEDDIFYDTEKNEFEYETSDNDVSANISEMNVISVGGSLLGSMNDDGEVFCESELMEFMNFLAKEPMMGFKHIVGKKILWVITKTEKIIGFDRNEYYHSRINEINAAPFVEDQMKKAPYGVTGFGRFNIPGHSFYYFADSLTGAQKEVRKHFDKDEAVVQTALLAPVKEVNILDISQKSMRRYNTFLKYLRFHLSKNSGNLPREYLIPAFLANCCFDCHIDGIKYYGGSDYSNYVLWNGDELNIKDPCFDRELIKSVRS